MTPTPQRPTETPSLTPTPNYPIYTGPPLDPATMGVQLHIHREDLPALMDRIEALGVGWVKTQVSWKLFQPEPDRTDDFLWAELDQLVAEAEARKIKVLLGVAKAPEWSRSTTELDGPPRDYDLYRQFMALLASRYQGRVAAYELWNEANLQREWNGQPLSAAALVKLIAAGAAGVRAADPEAILISGAPATTGINDGLTAIDDRLYMQQMLAAGVLTYVDAIGAHPYGWANPPDSTAANPDPAVPSHNNHPSFFFADTLADYHALLDQAGQPDTPIWITEFGWGSYGGLGAEPPEGVAYMGYVDEQQQATYILRAYELLEGLDWSGPAILWNLNFAPTFGPDFVESAYSLLGIDGSPRPAFSALSAAQKTAGSGAP